MSPEELKVLQLSSPLAWITLNKMVNENQREIEFTDHRFMIDIYADTAPDICCIKSAQVGFSVFSILRSFHELKYERRNVLYALPTRNVVQDFVVPKVNPLITSNPVIGRDLGSDSVSLKRLGDRFIFFKGGSEREAISVSTDTLVIDEYDKMPDMGVVTMFDSRLNFAKEPRRRRFSNPTGMGFGIHSLWLTSNQFHWMVTCHTCGHEYYLDFEKTGAKVHYVHKERQAYVCGNEQCEAELSDHDRRMGRWVARFPKVERHGYWISQMMAPWVTAKRILEQYEEMTTEVFHSMVLGKAYTPSDLIVDRQTILRACVPSTIPRIGVAMGVDQKASEMEWVAGTSLGIFAYGRAKSWEEIEHMKRTWNAILVADAMPYTTGPKLLAEKYSDVFMCYFKDTKGLDVLEWKGSVVYADRTRLLDIVAKEITDASLLFRMRPQELEEYIADWKNIYRTTVEEPDGRIKSQWLKVENKESDFSFATAYFRIALSRQLNSGSLEMISPTSKPTNITDEVTPNGTLTTVNEAVRETMEQFD